MQNEGSVEYSEHLQLAEIICDPELMRVTSGLQGPKGDRGGEGGGPRKVFLP